MGESRAMDILEHFSAGKDATIPPDVLSELQSILRIHQLSAEDLFYKWESYCIKMDIENTQLTMERVRAFKQDIQDALERSSRQAGIKAEKKAGATPRAGAGAGDVFGMLDGLVPTTPATARPNKSSSLRKKTLETPSVTRAKAEVLSSSPDHKTPARMEDQLSSLNTLAPAVFSERTGAGDVSEVLNDHVPRAEPIFAPFPEPRVKLTAASDQKKLSFKPLAMKLSEASEVLDDRIDDFANLVMQHHGLEASSFGSPAAQSTVPVIAVGRIASDSVSGGKLNAVSIVMETSRRTGGGLRVPLNLGKIRGYAVFPGQIVAVRGINSSGYEFVVDEMLEIPSMASAASSVEALRAHRDRLLGSSDAMDTDSPPAPLTVLFAAGPYTPDDNLDFEALHELCSQAADTHVDALVLTGPFLDAEHPLVATGDFDLPPDLGLDPDTTTMNTVFKHLVTPAINRAAASNPGITIIMVPSTRDVIDKHVAWPQDALVRKELGLARQVRMVSNPITLFLNEALLGVSSQDILWELRGETFVGGRGTDDDGVLSRLCRHLIEQRHYFPLFPPMERSKLPKTGTEEALAPGAMLDTSYLKLGEIVNVKPDIILTPSALPPFAKVVESVVVINPGSLSRRRGAGTYAKMTLHPISIDEGAQGMQRHRVFDRVRVENIRI